MAIRGRKPKPTMIKVFEGNPGHRALNQNEPKPPPLVSGCPDWLDNEAKAEWERIGGPLKNMGVLTEADMAVFAGYCQSWARLQQAEKSLSKNGFTIKTSSGYLQQVPEVSIAQNYLKIMLKFCEQLGLTPSSRSRIAAIKTTEDTTDEMEKLLRGI